MTSMNRSDPVVKYPFVFLGGAGHAKLILSCMEYSLQKRVSSVVSIGGVLSSPFASLTKFASDEEFFEGNFRGHLVINGIGANPDILPRKQAYLKYKSRGYNFETIVASSAVAERDVSIGEGAIILPNATINSGAQIDDNVVIYTSSIVEHDTHIGHHCQISPGAIVLGSATIEEGTFIGAGAIIFPGVKIGANSIVGAGQIVKSDIANGSVVR